MTNLCFSRKHHQDLLLERGLLLTFSLNEPTSVSDGYREFLTQHEFERSQRFVAESLRRRFLLMRGRLREVLGAFLDVFPRHVFIEQEAFGKPKLGDCHDNALKFNVSHSGDHGAIFLQHARWVGVDLEGADPTVDIAMVANELFTKHEQKLWRDNSGQEDTHAQFMRAWVSKEAILKAIGLGIAEGLHGVTLPDEFFDRPSVDFFEPSIVKTIVKRATTDRGLQEKFSCDWKSLRVRLLDVEPGFFLAVCSDSNLENILYGSWKNFAEDSYPDCC